jgi:hypothetical protein
MTTPALRGLSGGSQSRAMRPRARLRRSIVVGSGATLTVSVFTLVMPKPVSLAPSPLALTAGRAQGTLTATLSPTPTAAGSLGVTSANPAIAAVPASVAFASGQTSVALPVSGLASGSTTISVSANGGQAAATVNVNAPPAVSITAPANNAVFAAGASIALNATAADSDGTVAKVEFYDGATLLGTATATPYGATLTNAGVGSHVLSAVATDNRGASTSSGAISVRVDAPPTATARWRRSSSSRARRSLARRRRRRTVSP